MCCSAGYCKVVPPTPARRESRCWRRRLLWLRGYPPAPPRAPQQLPEAGWLHGPAQGAAQKLPLPLQVQQDVGEEGGLNRCVPRKEGMLSNALSRTPARPLANVECQLISESQLIVSAHRCESAHNVSSKSASHAVTIVGQPRAIEAVGQPRGGPGHLLPRRLNHVASLRHHHTQGPLASFTSPPPPCCSSPATL